MRKGENELTNLGKIVFFLDVMIAMLIVVGSTFLLKTPFGKSALMFGFVMIAVTTGLRFARKW